MTSESAKQSIQLMKSIEYCSSESTEYPSTNLLEGKQWKCEKNIKGITEIVIAIQKGKITKINLKNDASAAIEVMVSENVGKTRRQNFQPFLPLSPLLTSNDVLFGKNLKRVRCFTKSDFHEKIRSSYWTVVKIKITPPHQLLFGLEKLEIFGETFEAAKNARKRSSTDEIQPRRPKRLRGLVINDDHSDDEGDDRSIAVGKEYELNRRKETAMPTVVNDEHGDANNEVNRRIGTATPTVVNDEHGDVNNEIPAEARKTDVNGVAVGQKNKENAQMGSIVLFSILAHLNQLAKAKEIVDQLKENRSIVTTNVKQESANNTNQRMDLLKDANLSIGNTNVNQRSGNNKRPYESVPQGSRSCNKRARLPIAQNQIMANVVYTIQGIENNLKARIRLMADEMGAQYNDNWDTTCTHIICLDPDSRRLEYARQYSRVVRSEWIIDSYIESKFKKASDYFK